MENLKDIFAKKLLKLRTGAGMTQSELGDKLSYSDKTVSKWERGEAIPDATVLKKISRIFGISVDNLLDDGTEQAAAEKKQESTKESLSYAAVTRVTVVGIWTLAVLVFAVLWICDIVHWMIFIYAIPVTLITLLVFNSTWNKGKGNFWIVSGLVLSLLVLSYLISLPWKNPWQLFLVAVPAELLVFCCFHLKKRQK